MTTENYSTALGYSAKEQAAAPEGSNLGLGSGTPIAAAKVQPGQTVLNLSSGAGFDCFLAAAEVGPTEWAPGFQLEEVVVSALIEVVKA